MTGRRGRRELHESITDVTIVFIRRDVLRQQCKLTPSIISIRIPTYISRIFVPCRDGVSHNPAEYCSPEDCANGAQVLLGAMLHYDRLRAGKGA